MNDSDWLKGLWVAASMELDFCFFGAMPKKGGCLVLEPDGLNLVLSALCAVPVMRHGWLPHPSCGQLPGGSTCKLLFSIGLCLKGKYVSGQVVRPVMLSRVHRVLKARQVKVRRLLRPQAGRAHTFLS